MNTPVNGLRTSQEIQHAVARHKAITIIDSVMETIRGLFHRPTPQEQVPLSPLSTNPQLQKWKATIRREERLLDRQIASLKESEDKSRRMLQQLAKKRPQDVGSARMLAKELVRARKQRQRMYQSKATLNSVQMQLQEQVGMFFLFCVWLANGSDI